MIITDDQGYGDIGAHGNPHINTPNLDLLHSESIRLTNYHVGTTCAPSRAALMTGRDGNKVGVWHTIAGRSLLNKEETTMAENIRPKRISYRDYLVNGTLVIVILLDLMTEDLMKRSIMVEEA